MMFKVPDWEDTPTSNHLLKVSPVTKEKRKNKKVSAVQQKKIVNTKAVFKIKNNAYSTLKTDTVLITKNKKKDIETNKPRRSKRNNHKQKNLDNVILNDNNKNFAAKKQIKNYDDNKLDELILHDKKQKVEAYKNDDDEEILFRENPKDIKVNIEKNNSNKRIDNNKNTRLKKMLSMSKKNISDKIQKPLIKNANEGKGSDNSKTTIIKNKKKEIIKSLLQNVNVRNHITVSSNKLRDRMMERLKAAKFRYLNEKLYTSRGSDAQKLFQEDPTAFQTYHEGYQQQVKKWPVKPLDVIVKRIQKMPKTCKIADMGCGEAELSRRVVQPVRSFDLVGSSNVEACDMAHTPLLAASMDVAVYCLALMGTELTQYLVEANRILRVGGHLLIAEVESRFDNVDAFTKEVQRLGFTLKKLDKTNQVFFFMEFTKIRDPPVKKSKLPILTLKPCIYKKR